MSYIVGVVAPVRAGVGAEEYRVYAEAAATIFKDHGAIRVVDAWGDAVPRGERTDFFRAVAAGEGETVVFSWIESPDRATHDVAMPRVMADPRMQPGAMPIPIEGKRMIFGGFHVLLDA